jgi:hypothetical protein
MATSSLYWQAVKLVLDGAAVHGDAAGKTVMTDRELVRAGFNFEHTGSIRELARGIDGLPVPNGATADRRWQRRADALAISQYAAERSQFRQDLEALVLGAGLDASRRRQVGLAASRVLPVPQHARGAIGYRPASADGLSAGLGFILEKLMVAGNDLLPDTRRCQWAECQRYFFVSDANKGKDPKEGGRRRDKYCGPKCMREAWKARKR